MVVKCNIGCGKGSPERVPTWPEVAANLIEEMAKWKKAGYPISPKPLHDRRFSVCKVCPAYRHFRCDHCGCFMLAKTALRTAVCPLGKW